ncbi:MAG: HoxN/HupN/NixA family nickel/cobalt transporter [Bacteroidales bacterium]|nr:HoxN/HupN/NixA family nickel/cobalt transporter [Bacteroidales bacterium]
MDVIKKRSYYLIIFLILFNIISWLFLMGISKFSLPLLSLGSLAYFFGMRHAFDADHIAAIDNVTRKLRQDGKKPVSVGMFFSLGHSTVVLLLSLAIIIAFRKFSTHIHVLESLGGIMGTVISASFLTLIGLINFFILKNLYRLFKTYKHGNEAQHKIEKLSDELLNKRGLMSRFFRFAYRSIDRSYKMYPLGFLFGLGFDTATEVAVLGISATVAKNSQLPIWGILAFPILFAAGMSLMDSLDGLIMMKIYDWAMMDAVRKVFFNMVITGTSVFVALAIGTIEWIQVVATEVKTSNPFFNFLNNLDFSVLGVGVVFIMLVSWLSAFIYYRKVLS